MKTIFKKSEYEKYYRGILPYLKEEKNQKYLTIILTFGASIFFLLFAISPTLSTITKLKKEIADSRFVEEKLSQKINSLSSLSQAYQNVEGDISFVTDAVPDKPESPILTAQLQAVAKNSSVSLTNIDINPIDLTDKKATSSSSFRFEILASGEYADLKQFINNLKNMQRVISIDTISITKGTDVNSGIDLNIKGTAYYKKL
ncbi:MAG: type 4a pilus biogenesis protein PilO [Patescibacteria group bacterium]